MWQKFFLTLVWLLSCLSVQAQWNLVKENGGIKVYTADSESSPVNAVKVEATVKGTCQKLVSVLLAIEKQPQWVYATSQAYLIRKISENELLYYVETALPWPAKNRDAVIRMNIVENTVAKARITTVGEPDAIAGKSGKMRVSQFSGIWEAVAVDNKHIHIVYELNLNPGGSLPAGIVNIFVSKGPYETFANLSQLLAD